MAVIRTIAATDAEALREISGWIHDADIRFDECTRDERRQRVTVAFEQEPLDPTLGLPAATFVRRSWWSTEYRLPYVRCRLHIDGATGWDGLDPDLDGPGQLLLGVDWEPGRSRVTVNTALGPIRIQVWRLDVELEITDETVSLRTRRVGRLIRFASTSGRER